MPWSGRVNPLSPHDLIATLGPWAMLLVLFAETGLLIGFFLPGDSLLFTAGLLTATTSSGPASGARLGPGRCPPPARCSAPRSASGSGAGPGRRCWSADRARLGRGASGRGIASSATAWQGGRAGPLRADRPHRDQPAGRRARRPSAAFLRLAGRRRPGVDDRRGAGRALPRLARSRRSTATCCRSSRSSSPSPCCRSASNYAGHGRRECLNAATSRGDPDRRAGVRLSHPPGAARRWPKGIDGYDDGVYYSAADAVVAGEAPYRDFVLLHPPGLIYLLTPFAALGPLVGDANGWATARVAMMAGRVR